MRDLNGERRIVARLYMWAGLAIISGIVLVFAGAQAWLIQNWSTLGWPAALALQGVWLLVFGWIASKIAGLASRGFGGV